LKQEKDDDQAKNEKEIPINLTPEFTFNNLPDFVKANRSLLPSSDQLKTERMHREDPDVTQLEIDISSASLTAPYSQNSNVKKRQLILLNENLDDHSIISNVMSPAN
jgi:hypothetical protein